jgi:hypothetical protein
MPTISEQRAYHLRRLDHMRDLIKTADMSKIDVTMFYNPINGKMCWGGLAAQDSYFQSEGLGKTSNMVYFRWHGIQLTAANALAAFFDIPLSEAETLFSASHPRNYSSIEGDIKAQEAVRATAIKRIDRIRINKHGAMDLDD